MGCICTSSKEIRAPAPRQLYPITRTITTYRPPLTQLRPPMPIVVPKQKVFIESKHQKEDVKYLDHTPSGNDLKLFSYNCPICFRYFTNIMTTKCCQNYICIQCTTDLQLKKLNFEISCPHCRAVPLCLVDVNLGLPIKNYLDSPNQTKIDSSMSFNLPNDDNGERKTLKPQRSEMLMSGPGSIIYMNMTR